MRISFGTKLRNGEIEAPLSAITTEVARPRLTALTTELLTASSGHMPSSCTTPVFCFHRPLWKISLYSCRLIFLPLSARVGAHSYRLLARTVWRGSLQNNATHCARP